MSAHLSFLDRAGTVTVALIGSIGLLALLAWQVWMDATFMITAFSLIGGLLAAFIGWQSAIAIQKAAQKIQL